MRPEVLFPLFAPVTKLPGVGPRIAKLIERLAGPNVVDRASERPRDVPRVNPAAQRLHGESRRNDEIIIRSGWKIQWKLVELASLSCAGYELFVFGSTSIQ